ncbi:Tryptophan aminotransferase-related protein 2 [Morella rubra]|uniref:Tryptophan aminotransferase-related protein 2 n=1 Tax=Morella rubra TaxID=262757 RepID=A0A6A1W992_9ROSI|nr:Tryptophan aminotransferase-related protein 2 [Morella rubra]
MRHWFLLSLALNVSLILSIVNEFGTQKAGEVSQTMQLCLQPSSSCAATTTRTEPPDDGERVFDLSRGDPTMYEAYWKKVGDEATVVIPGSQSMSYFSDVTNICWFLEPELGSEVRRLHKVVGNAVTEGRHVVVGTGSSQLFLAALYALSPQDAHVPISVVAQVPYYSVSLPDSDGPPQARPIQMGRGCADFQQREDLYRTCHFPNNPDGYTRGPVVNGSEGILVHDLAYYWPQYTPISSPADHDLMLFTLSKSTGHGGTRIGWALVKDQEVARRMIKFIELTTIGVSKDAQLRAAKILRVISDSSERTASSEQDESFFEFSHHLLAKRWKLLREAVEHSEIFSLPVFLPAFCTFRNRVSEPQPAVSFESPLSSDSMAKLTSVFSMRHWFLLSLALNVSLILSIVNEFGTQKAGEVSQTMQLCLQPSSSCAATTTRTEPPDDGERVFDLSRGDPTMYEAYWKKVGDEATVVIPGSQSMSYFSDVTNICWFLEPELGSEVRRLHKVVGNAVTEGRHIVVGTGSSQLFLAALYALSPQDAHVPISVVAQVPYYSVYPILTDLLKPGLFKWAGDAQIFNKERTYIELVTSPNNPDGYTRGPVVNGSEGILVHDLAYYWPQYTPISSPADHDLMLFTLSKSTGHGGTRIGWALVKDQEVARRMIKFIELTTIGVSKDAQLRAAKILRVISDSSERTASSEQDESFFEFSHHLLAKRWKLLREAVEHSEIFSLPVFLPAFCTFRNRVSEPQPGFAWLKCEGDIEDCESFLRGNKGIILDSRREALFEQGSDPKYDKGSPASARAGWQRVSLKIFSVEKDILVHLDPPKFIN